jgi:hypothetical protein
MVEIYRSSEVSRRGIWIGTFRRAAIAALIVIPASVLIMVAPAGAAASISVAPATSPAGKAVVFSGSVPTTGTAACPSGDPVTIVATDALFPGGGVGPQVQRDASGNFSVSYTIPTSTPAGSYSVGMRCGGGNVGVTTTLTVEPASVSGATATPTGMPWSGSRPYVAGIVGLGAALVGLGYLRRRRIGC